MRNESLLHKLNRFVYERAVYRNSMDVQLLCDNFSAQQNQRVKIGVHVKCRRQAHLIIHPCFGLILVEYELQETHSVQESY